MRVFIVLFLAFLCWLAPVVGAAFPHTHITAMAANISSETALSRLFTTPEINASWFADSFLSQISLAQIEQILQGITATMGQFQSAVDSQ
ncbi:MAG: hypothetical protein AAGA46_07535 [Cyanobacteria bacterium P01_F01_bin.13]